VAGSRRGAHCGQAVDDAAKARQALFGRRFGLMTLPASFSTHQDPFAFGDVPCTLAGMPEAAVDETATRRRAKTASVRRRRPVTSRLKSTRSRRPRRCNSRRNASSGDVPVPA
jgi:hypothetical protein